MQKYKHHIGLTLGSLLGLLMFFYTLFDVKGLIDSMQSMDPIIKTSNREFFGLCGISFPILHLFYLVLDFFPHFQKIEKRKINIGVGCTIAVFAAIGIILSYAFLSDIKKRGYQICQEASDSQFSLISRYLVYTLEDQTCYDYVKDNE